jgi:hypothetical protein
MSNLVTCRNQIIPIAARSIALPLPPYAAPAWPALKAA